MIGKGRAERVALQELGNDVVDAVVRADVEDGEKIRMAERTEEMSLMLKALTTIGVIGERFREDFDGDVPIKACVLCFIDFAHAARTKRRRDFIGAQVSAWSKGHRWRDYSPRIALLHFYGRSVPGKR